MSLYTPTVWVENETPRSAALFNKRETAIQNAGAVCVCRMTGTHTYSSGNEIYFGTKGTPPTGTFYNSLGLPYTDYIKTDGTDTYNLKFYVPSTYHKFAMFTFTAEPTTDPFTYARFYIYIDNDFIQQCETTDYGDILCHEGMFESGHYIKFIYHTDPNGLTIKTALNVFCF